MTQTPRDWQKDMEMCDKYGNSELPFKDTVFAEMLPYWLQEAKILQEIASGRGREALRLSKLLGDLNDELTASEERADAAEDREQQLKELLEKIDDETRDEWIGVMIKELLSTLYPDTPAPKEGE